ncbi:HNH endonuclease signature motif containing protein [Candidatus Mycobacterium wuenschmannii]|uniref:HNH endonuclease signature motif containing protein n=1 Tax=Candidatus Mycobacterium wuenschmannii TaxID=3027808 RepID=A0ABY8VUQ2_9MYCO|nr:HNH endonuclease signature motif containing protein [Candidatus Mycobacterium wuenschmannii]WIM87242.1 HNH endonuclease signature motif containing protein [Candidatus Mycobacterium wuenschmannii]
MFEPPVGTVSSPEVIARFDELFERRHPSCTAESSALLDRIATSWRDQNRGAAAALSAIGELFAYRLTRCSDTEEWAVDTEAAVSAEVAAALRMSQALAGSQLRYARAMRERLPKLAEVFKCGDIDQRTFATVVYRTDLIDDSGVLATVDGQLALSAVRWPSMTRGQLAGQIDKIVAKADADAVRRRKERRDGREVWFADHGDGLSQIHGSMLTPEANALDKRLTALAGTVCAQDPRTREQRRADALGALATGTDRLSCRCGRPDCEAETRPAATSVVIHVIAEESMASEVRADGLVGPELIAELAGQAKLVPLVHPADAPPEPGYVPSKALADFVRCRDLTCRWPGCDHPAFNCDIDHTVPYGDGGPTHASNLKCYCRTHHLAKTFWGWRDRQLPDGTVILESPAGKTYVTTPGSAWLFPGLCSPTGDLPPAPRVERCADRNAMMPRRRRTRDQDRGLRVSAERQRNHNARIARRAKSMSRLGPAPPGHDDPPPF